MADKDRIGALWLKEDKNGKKYMSGEIELNGEKVNIFIFKNKYKKKDIHPDYVIKKSNKKSKNEEAPF